MTDLDTLHELFLFSPHNSLAPLAIVAKQLTWQDILPALYLPPHTTSPWIEYLIELVEHKTDLVSESEIHTMFLSRQGEALQLVDDVLFSVYLTRVEDRIRLDEFRRREKVFSLHPFRNQPYLLELSKQIPSVLRSKTLQRPDEELTHYEQKATRDRLLPKGQVLWYDKTLQTVGQDQPWREMVPFWWSTVTLREPLSRCLYWYAWNNDTYLNAACRNRPYSRSRMYQHMLTQFLYGTTLHRTEYHVGLDLVNPSCQDIALPIDLYYKHRYGDQTLTTDDISVDALFEEYHASVINTIALMHETFCKSAMTMDREGLVYRSLIVPRGHGVLEQVHGYNSTSYTLAGAIQVANSIISSRYSTASPIRHDTHELHLFEIRLPAGTHVLPAEVCARFQNEHEIILVSQGQLRIESQGTDAFSHPVLPMTMYKCTLETTEPFPTLYPLVLTEDEVIYGKKKRSRCRSRRSGFKCPKV